MFGSRLILPCLGVLAICLFNACSDEAPSQACSSNQECKSGTICLAGSCRSEDELVECESDLDCQINQICDLMTSLCMNLDAGVTRSVDASVMDVAVDTDTGMTPPAPDDAGTPDAMLADAGEVNEPLVFVSQNGNDRADGRSPMSALRTINAGLTKASSCAPELCDCTVSNRKIYEICRSTKY